VHAIVVVVVPVLLVLLLSHKCVRGSGKSNFVSAFYKESRSDRCPLIAGGGGDAESILLARLTASFLLLCAIILLLFCKSKRLCSLWLCGAALFRFRPPLLLCAQMLFVVVVAVCHFDALHAFSIWVY